MISISAYLSVCQWGYLRNYTCDLYQILVHVAYGFATGGKVCYQRLPCSIWTTNLHNHVKNHSSVSISHPKLEKCNILKLAPFYVSCYKLNNIYCDNSDTVQFKMSVFLHKKTEECWLKAYRTSTVMISNSFIPSALNLSLLSKFSSDECCTCTISLQLSTLQSSLKDKCTYYKTDFNGITKDLF